MTEKPLQFAKPTAVRNIRWDGVNIVDVTEQ